MKKKLEKGGFGTTGLVCGICSLILFGIPLGILAIVFGAIAMNKEQRFGVAGVVLGIVGMLAAILMLALGFW